MIAVLVDAIAHVPTTTKDGFNDVPVEPVVIRRACLEN
jgi:hypothetical protein